MTKQSVFKAFATHKHLLLSFLVLTGCALPDIERDTPADAGRDEKAVLDPAQDPANRNEDYATFRSLLPREHNFAEWPMPDSSPDSAAKPVYEVEERVVIDKVTNLRWQRHVPDKFPGCKGRYPLRGMLQEEGTGCTWKEAREYCSQPEIAEMSGPGAWRLPTKIELESLLDMTAETFAIDPAFMTHPIDFFWSATPIHNPGGLNLAWAVDFSDGYPQDSGRFKAGRVRCVSSVEPSDVKAPDHKVGLEVVNDQLTQLVWQNITDSKTRTFEQALQYCKELELAGGGWRLPTLKELLTLVDPARGTDALIPSFAHAPFARFWTSTQAKDVDDYAYEVNFDRGGALYTSTSDEHFVRCVR